MWNICSGTAKNSRDLSEFLVVATPKFGGKDPYPRQIPKSDIAGGDWICAVTRWSPTKFDLRYCFRGSYDGLVAECFLTGVSVVQLFFWHIEVCIHVFQKLSASKSQRTVISNHSYHSSTPSLSPTIAPTKPTSHRPKPKHLQHPATYPSQWFPARNDCLV